MGGNKILAIGLLMILTSKGFAAAWVNPEGKLLVINTTQHYSSTGYWNTQGQLEEGPYPYHQLSNDTYIEYGINETVTLGGNIYLDNAGQKNPPPTESVQTGMDLLSTEIFLQFELWKHDWDTVSFMIRGYVPWENDPFPFPFPLTENTDMNIGSPFYQYGTAIKLMYGTGGALPDLWGSSWYLSVEGGFDYYFDPDLSQLGMDFQLGWKTADERWLAQLKSYNIVATAMPVQDGVVRNFDLYSLQSGIVFFPLKQFGIELGWSKTLAGANIGTASAPYLSLWIQN